MCTIITIFEHTLSDNHGAVDVLLRSTTITVDTHFLDSFFIAPSRVLHVLFSLILFTLSLARSACVSYGTRAWKRNIVHRHTHTQKIDSKYNAVAVAACISIHRKYFILNAFESIWCIDLLVCFSFIRCSLAIFARFRAYWRSYLALIDLSMAHAVCTITTATST